MSDEQQIAALWQEIRLAAREICLQRQFRWAIPVLIGVFALAAYGCAVMALRPTDGIFDVLSAGMPLVLLAVSVVLLLAAVYCLLEGFPFATRKERGEREQLRRALALRPATDVASVLLPLRTELPAREFVAPLLREFGLSTELAPATAPDGRGDKASPAEAKP